MLFLLDNTVLMKAISVDDDRREGSRKLLDFEYSRSIKNKKMTQRQEERAIPEDGVFYSFSMLIETDNMLSGKSYRCDTVIRHEEKRTKACVINVFFFHLSLSLQDTANKNASIAIACEE
jgi:hypothetical protein